VIDASLPLQICQIALLSALMALGSVVCWTMVGQWLRQFLHTSKRLRWFSYSMAFWLLGSMVPTRAPTTAGASRKAVERPVDKGLISK
jgi:threonine/homoserine/homoserine lactone efflux protein